MKILDFDHIGVGGGAAGCGGAAADAARADGGETRRRWVWWTQSEGVTSRLSVCGRLPRSSKGPHGVFAA